MTRQTQKTCSDVLLLRRICKTLSVGHFSLGVMLSDARNPVIREELLSQQRRYRELGRELEAALSAKGAKPPEPGLLPRLGMEWGIRSAVRRNPGRRNLATMLTEGSGQGATGCARALHDHPHASPEALVLAHRVERLMLDTEQRWRALV